MNLKVRFLKVQAIIINISIFSALNINHSGTVGTYINIPIVNNFIIPIAVPAR